jgi:hypothetical protein
VISLDIWGRTKLAYIAAVEEHQHQLNPGIQLLQYMYKSQQLNSFRFRKLGLLIALLAWSGRPVFSQDGYSWSKNIPVEIPTSERIQAETALATDAQQRVWLVFLDAQYHETATHTWIAWPRRVRLFTSVDKGASFKPQLDLDPMGDSAKLITTANGEVLLELTQS